MHNTRTLEIVEALLDLNETLDSKMALLTQQFTEFPEEQIRQMAEADPTSPQRADYVMWLLRLRRQNAWDGQVEPIRTHLARYDEIKKAQDFTGKTDIGQYKKIDELVTDLEANKLAGSHAQKAATGAKRLSQSGDLSLFQMLTPDAARKFAIGQGSVPAPQTVWCFIALETAKDYINNKGGLFIVLKGPDSYVSVCFGSRPEAKNIRNKEITMPVAKEIAPLFDIPMFEKEWTQFQYRPTNWTVTDRHLEAQLLRLIKRWYNEKLEGHAHPRTGDWVLPTIQNAQEAREGLRTKLKSFFDLFITAIRAEDETIIRQFGERNGETNGLQALYNAIYESHNMAEGAALPLLLQDFAAFNAKYDELAAAYEQKYYPNR